MRLGSEGKRGRPKKRRTRMIMDVRRDALTHAHGMNIEDVLMSRGETTQHVFSNEL